MSSKLGRFKAWQWMETEDRRISTVTICHQWQRGMHFSGESREGDVDGLKVVNSCRSRHPAVPEGPRGTTQ